MSGRGLWGCLLGVLRVSGGCFGLSLLCPGYINSKSIEKSLIGIVLWCIPVAYFRPKKAFWPKFSTVGGRVFFGVNGHFLWFIWPSYGHKKTMGMVVKKIFDRTHLSPYPTAM